MAKKILFTSLKGGTGVTTCCVGLGVALSELGERTLILDGDAFSANAMLVGGCGNMQVYTLADYEKGACRAKQAILPHRKFANLCFMPSLGLKDLSVAAKAVSDVDGLFDYILMDKAAAECCDSALIVTEPFAPSIKSADCCRAMMFDRGIKDIGLIVNKLNGGQVISGAVLTAREIADVLHLPLKAVIPEDLNISAGKWKTETLKAFRIAAAAISGKKDGLCNVLTKYAGLNGFIKRKMREKI